MDRSAVEALVDRELGDLRDMLGLGHWTVTVRFDLRDGDEDWQIRGRCRVATGYDRALIRLDPETLRDEADARDVLVHELLHVVLSPFELLVDACRPVLEKDETTMAVLENVRLYAVEQAVHNLERMCRGLQRPPETPKPIEKTPKRGPSRERKSRR